MINNSIHFILKDSREDWCKINKLKKTSQTLAKNHTFLRIALIFSVVLILCSTLISFYSIYTYKKNAIEQATKSNQVYLNLVTNNIDLKIDGLHRTSLDLMQNMYLSNFPAFDLASSPPEKLFKRRDAMQGMNHVQMANPDIESIWLYGGAQDAFFTSEGFFSREDFFNYRSTLSENKQAQLQEEFAKISPLHYVYTSPINKGSENPLCLTFVRSYSTYSSYPNGHIIINVNKHSIDQYFNAITPEENISIYMFSPTQELITSSTNAPLEDSQILIDTLSRENFQEKTFSIDYNGKEYTGNLQQSPKNQYIYVALVDNALLFHNIQAIQTVTLLITLFSLLVALSLSIFRVYRLFLPVKKLLTLIALEQELTGTTTTSSSKDFALIEHFLSYVQTTNTNLKQQLTTQEAVLLQSLLFDLLFASANERSTLCDNYQKYGVSSPFQHPYYTIGILYLEKSEEHSLLKVNSHLSQLVSEEPFAQKAIVAVLQQQGVYILFVNTIEDATATIEALFHKMEASLPSSTSSLLWGNTYGEEKSFSVSYYQALNMLSKKQNDVTAPITNYHEMLTHSRLDSFFSEEKRAELLSLLENSSEKTSDWITRLLVDMKAEQLSYMQLEGVYLELLSILIKQTRERQVNFSSIFSDTNNAYQVLDSFSSLEEKEEFLRRAFYTLQTSQDGEDVKKSFLLYQEMLHYIQQNYQSDISLSHLSYEKALSPSYLSALFKEENGINFLEYLNKYRIQKAKELLIHTELLVGNIALQVGFNNANSFIRVFKKETTLTPGQYRDRNKG